MKSLYEFMTSLDDAFDNQELDFTGQRFRLRMQEKTWQFEKQVFLFCTLFDPMPERVKEPFVSLLLDVLNNGRWYASWEKQRRLKKLSKRLSKAMKKEPRYEVRSIIAKISELWFEV